jgi:hypothetical protein
MSFATIDIAKRANCAACHGELSGALPREKLVWLCGLGTANINPEKPFELNLNQIYETAKKHFNVKVKSNMVIVFEYKDLQVSLFNGGRMLIKNVKDEKAALRAYREIIQTLKPNN